MSELRDLRLDRLEADMHEVKAILERLAPLVIRIDQRLTSELPHLATKAELAAGLAELREALADKPSRGYLWGVMGAMVGAQAVALAAAALIFSIVQTRMPPAAHAAAGFPFPLALASERVAETAPAFDWDQYHARQDACRDADRIAAACAKGACDELALRQAKRDCSAFGPLGGRH